VLRCCSNPEEMTQSATYRNERLAATRANANAPGPIGGLRSLENCVPIYGTATGFGMTSIAAFSVLIHWSPYRA